MAARLLSFPSSPRVTSPTSAIDGNAMHGRFEARRLSLFIIGPRPRVRILEIAWLDKQQHIVSFLNDYYARHQELPRGRHDLGRTPSFGLRIGELDFDRARARMKQSIAAARRRGHRLRQLRALLGIFRPHHG